MRTLTAIIKKGEKQFVALCPELDVVSQGYTIEEAIKNLKEADVIIPLITNASSLGYF